VYPALHVKPHVPPLHWGVALATLGQTFPQRPQLFASVLVSMHEPPHMRPQALAAVQHLVHPKSPHDGHMDALHVAESAPAASLPPASEVPESLEHTPAWQGAPIAVQSWHPAPPIPQVMSDDVAQAPLVSQQPLHVCEHVPPVPSASTALSYEEPVAPLSDTPPLPPLPLPTSLP
jgi:hypothetical protein